MTHDSDALAKYSCYAEAVTSPISRRGLYVRVDSDDDRPRAVLVPFEEISAKSEVQRAGDSGMLIVMRGWAEERGWTT